MANSVCQVLLTEAPLLVPAERAPWETGAIVDFWGVVRETEADAKITGIDYEAHRDMAQHQLEVLAEKAREEFQLSLVMISHRLGFVPVAEASLLVRIASRHRGAALRACASVVDELKKRAPIWKHPIFEGSVQAKPESLRVTKNRAIISLPA